MKLGIYCIKDTKTEFMVPQVDMNESAAVRNFEHAVKATAGIMHTHPSDFELYQIGEFDSVSGIITAMQPTFVVSGSEVEHEL